MDDITSDWDSLLPFPYKVIDGALNQRSAQLVSDNWSRLIEAGWTKYRNKKCGLSNLHLMPEAIVPVIEGMYSRVNRDFLERLSGIENLLPDWTMFGGGLHHVSNGGSLGMHVDFNSMPMGIGCERVQVYRRINVMLYLNRDWKRAYGGQLFLGRNREVEVEPIFNRMIIFESSETSWHGHPIPLDGPSGYARRSIAWYWYTLAKPEWFENPHSTIYVG